MDKVRVGPVDITTNDLTQALKRIADVIGLENIVALSEAFGGERIYIPPLKIIYQAARDRQISDEFKGKHIPELAGFYGITRQRFYQILKKNAAKKTRRQATTRR